MYDLPEDEFYGGPAFTSSFGIIKAIGSPNYDYTKDDPYSPFYEPAVTTTTSSGGVTYSPGLWDPAVQEEKQSAVVSSGGGTLRRNPTGTSSTQITENILPSGPAPELDLPDFNAPEWDEDEIASLARKAAGPYVSVLRRGLNRTLLAIRSAEKNPVARAQMYRQALEGFGGEQGLGGVLAKARREGRADYTKKYGYEFTEAINKIQQQNQEKIANFNAAMMIYQSKIKQKTTGTKAIHYSGTPGLDSEGGVTFDSEGMESRRLSGGLMYPGESMSAFINPKSAIGSRKFFG